MESNYSAVISSHNITKGILFQADDSFLGILTVVMLSIISIFIISGNVLVIAAKIKQPQLMMVGAQTTTFFLINLAVTDLMVGLFLPVNIYLAVVSEQLITNYWACFLSLGFTGIFVGASTMFISLATTDRCLYIHKPFWHQMVFTPKMAYTATAMCWIMMMIFGVLPVFGWNNWDSTLGCSTMDIFPKMYVLSMFGSDGAILISITAMNMCIYRTASIQRKQIRAQQRYMACSATTNQTSQPRQSGKAGRVIATVIAVYIVCSTPHICINLSFALIESREMMKQAMDVMPWILLLRICNSGMNPIIYYIMMPTVREAMRKVVCRAAETR